LYVKLRGVVRAKGLSEVHGMTAILEVSAHLDLLVARGALRREKSGPINHYAVA
jgi:hypothetical protein